jgi:hypothetical protein
LCSAADFVSHCNIIVDQLSAIWHLSRRRQVDVSFRPPPKRNAVKGVVSNLNPETETMIRIVTLAAAAALIALPASAQSIHISTVGKSPEQVRAEVYAAATKLCWRETTGASFLIYEQRACVDETVKKALASATDPQLRLALR